MQKSKQNPINLGDQLELLSTIIRFLWRFRSDPNVLEPFLAWVKGTRGKSEENVSALRSALLAWRKVMLDREAAAYRVDRYLILGMGAVDLVLVPVIFPLGVPDRSLFIALLSLVISLVLVSTSLVVTFVQQDAGITSFGKIYSTLVSFALGFGATAIIATVWHSSIFIGVVFLILALAAFMAFVVYFTGLLWVPVYFRLIGDVSAPTTLDASDPNT
jgi:hypothetical protein